jgi:hypothetical protein
MKLTNRLLALSLLILFAGCVTADKVVLDNTPRPPTTSVDVFKDGKVPDRKYKQIAELSFLGPREEELRAQKRFTGQAEKMGGNGILFDVVMAGQKGGGSMYGFNSSTAWVFKGKVIVYEQ